MTNSLAIAKIRTQIIQGLAFQFAPLLIIGLVQSLFKTDSPFDFLPAAIRPLLVLYILGMFWWGYIICWRAAYKYAAYKGYSKRFGLLGIFSFLGIAILYVLKNKRLVNRDRSDDRTFENLSLTYLAFGSLAIAVILIVFFMLVLNIFAGMNIDVINEYFNNPTFDSTYLYFIVLFFGMVLAIALFILRELKQANVKLSHIIGAWKPQSILLAIAIGIALFLFGLSVTRTVLYLLSFIAPQYVLSRIDRSDSNITAIWIFYQLLWLLIIPLFRTFIAQGIILQKLSIDKDSIYKGILILLVIYTAIGIGNGAIIFAPIFGLVQTVLYLKTRQIIAPVISSVVCNSLISIRFYFGFTSGQDYFTSAVTIADYQTHYISYIGLNILYFILSASYLAYFIYHNYPRSSKILNLPYFANRLQ